MRTRIKNYAVPVIVAVTIFLLARFPLADCIDCEGLRPWGRDDAAYALRVNIWFAHIALSCGLVAFFHARWSWSVPFLLAFTDFFTQHVGGVAWWSLLNNEGPFIFLYDGAAGFGALLAGVGLRVMFTKIHRRHLQP